MISELNASAIVAGTAFVLPVFGIGFAGSGQLDSFSSSCPFSEASLAS